jgi:hypothetical protein
VCIQDFRQQAAHVAVKREDCVTTDALHRCTSQMHTVDYVRCMCVCVLEDVHACVAIVHE